jgi:hypothetical protein
VTVSISDGNGARPAAPGPAVAEQWTARYQEHLARTATRSRRTHEQYREVMARVAAGELAPEAIDGRLNLFLQLHGAEYADALAQLSMRFMTGVVHARTAYAYELLERIVPGSDTPPVEAAPALAPTDWSNWFQRLADYASRENGAVTAAARSLMERVATGELAPADMASRPDVQVDERLPRSVLDMVALSFDLLSGIDELSSRFGDQYLGSVLESGDPDAFSLRLEGPLGTTVVARLAVANTEAETASVRCVVTDVRRADGIGPAFEPDVTIDPERFVLAPGEESTVILSLVLDEAAYAPNVRYLGVLHVLTPEETLLELPLRVRARAAIAAAGS